MATCKQIDRGDSGYRTVSKWENIDVERPCRGWDCRRRGQVDLRQGRLPARTFVPERRAQKL